MANKAQITEMALSLFDSYDADSSGYLDVKEYKTIVKEVLHEVNKTTSVDDKKMNQLFTIYDSNSDSKISRKEFVKAIDDFVNASLI
jgi:Ca2+-binding EF-hand superfamily protein